MHIAEVVTIAKSLPLLRLNTYKSLILSYSADYRRILMKNRENMEEKFDFADFYESHYRSALRYASMYVFNDEDARDIVSDVLLRFLEQGEKLNRERNVVGLFFSMIYNKCMDLSSPQVALQADKIQIEADGRPFFG